MSNDDGRALSYLIAGFGLGTVVGTVIGMLVAPKAGRELRADIAEYSKDYIDKAKDMGRDAYEAGREHAREAYEAGRERAGEYSARVGERLAEVKEQLGEATQKLGDAVKASIERETGDKAEQPAE
jgi:gas vesicle protein